MEKSKVSDTPSDDHTENFEDVYTETKDGEHDATEEKKGRKLTHDNTSVEAKDVSDNESLKSVPSDDRHEVLKTIKNSDITKNEKEVSDKHIVLIAIHKTEGVDEKSDLVKTSDTSSTLDDGSASTDDVKAIKHA